MTDRSWVWLSEDSSQSARSSEVSLVSSAEGLIVAAVSIVPVTVPGVCCSSCGRLNVGSWWCRRMDLRNLALGKRYRADMRRNLCSDFVSPLLTLERVTNCLVMTL